MSNSLIFITGSTGFIGAEVVYQALEAGYRVRLSIRKPEQEALLKQRYPTYTSQIETIVIPDISKREAFDEAVLHDVEYIIHLASPVPGRGQDLKEDYIKPAVQGTEAILHAALRLPKIKTVVVTSSVLGLIPMDSPLTGSDSPIRENTGQVLPVDVDMEIPDGPESQATMYRISKILAHQATRDFLAQQKPAFKLLTTHPVFVVGENRFQSSAEQIDFVNGMLFTALKVEKPFFPSLWVDVKDVAAAHVRALESSTPTGTEFLLCCPGVSWDDVVTFVKKNYPEVECNLQPPFGPSGTVETGSAEKYLDMQWTAYEKTFRQVFEQQLSFKSKPSE